MNKMVYQEVSSFVFCETGNQTFYFNRLAIYFPNRNQSDSNETVTALPLGGEHDRSTHLTFYNIEKICWRQTWLNMSSTSLSLTSVSKIVRIFQPDFAFWTNVVDRIIFVCLMELLSRIITKLWKADLWFCEFCKCEISRVRGDYPFTALAGATIRIIRCWIKEFLCEHYYDNIIQYASYCISNFITWSFLTGFWKPFKDAKWFFLTKIITLVNCRVSLISNCCL